MHIMVGPTIHRQGHWAPIRVGRHEVTIHIWPLNIDYVVADILCRWECCERENVVVVNSEGGELEMVKYEIFQVPRFLTILQRNKFGFNFYLLRISREQSHYFPIYPVL